jgi:hypothetical protein
MNDLNDLLDRVATPATDVAADVSRGERALRRRRTWQASLAGLSVAAVVGGAVALGGSSTPRGEQPYSGRPSVASAAQQSRHPRPTHAPTHHPITAREAMRRENRQMSSPAGQSTLRTYHDVLAEHLDPGGTRLGPVNGELGGSDAFGTKLDWNHGGMLMIVVGTTWNRYTGWANPPAGGMRATSVDGDEARVNRAGDDLVVSVRHPDGTVVTLLLSRDFGNNGTSTSALDVTQAQLLTAAADPRIQLPPYLR